MTQISNSAAAREDARRPDGKFGHQDHPEAPLVNLGALPPPLDENEVLTRIADRWGEGMAHMIEQEMNECRTPEGRALFLRMADSYYGSNKHALYTEDMEKADELAALGYRDPAEFDVARFRVRHTYDFVDVLMRQQISKERLDAIDTLPLEVRIDAESRWVRESLSNARIEGIRELATTMPSMPNEERFLSLLRLDPEHGEARAARYIEAQAKGCRSLEVLEADRHSLDKLLALKAVSGRSNPVRLADAGHDADSVKSYGIRVASTYTRDDLDASGLTPKELRGYYRDQGTPLSYYVALRDAGVPNAAAERMLRSCLEDTSPKAMGRALKNAGLEAIANYAREGKKTLRPRDIEAVATLVQKGHPDRESLHSFASNINPAAVRYADVDRETETELTILARIVDANVSARQLAVMTRAGIPPHRVAEFKDSPDMWEAGAPFRDRFESEERQRQEKGWIKEAQPWPTTRDNYDKE